jgi:hypothetical protein
MVAASIVSSSGLYLLTLKIIALYWTLISTESFEQIVRAAIIYLVWLSLFFWIARFPIRIYLQLRAESRTSAEDFEGLRKIIESTWLTVVAGAMAIAGWSWPAFVSEWETWSFLMALPLAWLVGLRRLFALPSPADRSNSILSTRSSLPGQLSHTGSEWLRAEEERQLIAQELRDELNRR